MASNTSPLAAEVIAITCAVDPRQAASAAGHHHALLQGPSSWDHASGAGIRPTIEASPSTSMASVVAPA